MPTPPSVSPSIALEGHRLVDVLHQGANSLVVRAERLTDGTTVILKRLTGGQVTAARIARYHQEFALCRAIDSPAVVRALELHPSGLALTIAFEDIGATGLHLAFPPGTIDLPTLLDVGVGICEGLAALHDAGIVHRDLNPANVIRRADDGRVQLIDLGIASRLAHTRPVPGQALEGTPAYLAPEQTGRLDAGVDGRADLYALGATLFALWAGRPPFERDDLLALVHAHLAAPPPTPSACRPGLPAVLDAIILRLLAKDPTDRYQTARGIQADLERCRDALSTAGALRPFPLGAQDLPRELGIPDRLYGRAEAIARLTRCLRDDAGPVWALVSGYAGIGKSSLVRALTPAVTARQGLVLGGKFDQFNRGLAHGALSAALDGLVDAVLAQPDAVVARWRARAAEAVGARAGVLLPLAPRLIHLLGAVASPPELPASEAQARLHRTVCDLLAAWATPDRPLVLFLDDLQWADPASLALLRALLGRAVPHLLVVGAYRDNEVDAGHPLAELLEALARAEVATEHIALGPLTPADVRALLADTLRRPAADVEALAGPLTARTGGNPFFLRQVLSAAHRDGHLVLDAEHGGWRWPREALTALGPTANVVDVLTRQLDALPDLTRDALGYAACIGNRFDVDALALLLETSPPEAVEALGPAFERGLVRALATTRPRADVLAAQCTGGPAPRCAFAHDRVQQVAHALLTPAARAATHLRLGLALWRRAGGADEPDDLFLIVEHLEQGLDALTSATQRPALAALFLRATRRAQASTAHANAARYARTGRALLGEDAWRAAPDLALPLHLLGAESAYLAGDFEAADALYAQLEVRPLATADRVALRQVQADHYLLQGRYDDAVHATQDGLARLDQQLDAPDPEAARRGLLAEHTRIAQLLDGRPVEVLLDAPRAVGEATAAAIRLQYALFLAAYLSGRGDLALWALARMASTSIERGHAALSGYGYVGYGMVLSLEGRDFELGHRFARVGVDLAERFDSDATRAKTNFLFAADVHNWTQPITAGRPFYERAHEAALRSGDWLTVGYVFMQSGSDELTAGALPLELLEARYARRLAFLRGTSNDDAIELVRANVYQPILQLRGLTDAPHSLDTADFSEADYCARHATNPFYLAWLYAARLRAAVLLGPPASARVWADRVGVVEAYVPSHSKVPAACFHAALLRLALLRDPAEAEHREADAAELERLRGRLAHWAEACPANVAHKLALVDAERARNAGRIGAAVEHYEAARRGAEAAGALHEQSLATELFAAFWADQGRAAMAAALRADAAHLYERWGALAKVAALDPPTVVGVAPSPGTTHTRPPPDDSLDLESLVRAAEVLSGELDFEPLVRRLLQVVLAQSGAERSTLLLHDARWYLAARTTGDTFEALDGPDLEADAAAPLVPRALVRRVARTGRAERLDDARTHPTLADDPYVAAHGVRALLVLPLVRGGETRGVVVLEHRQARGVFLARHQRVLEHLSAQMVVALTNARLYAALDEARADLESRVEARTRALSEALANLEAAQLELVRTGRLASLSTMVAGVAHELNTPLGVALTAESVLSEALAGCLDPALDDALRAELRAEALDAAQLIRQNVDRAAQLVQAFKAVAADQAEDATERPVALRAYVVQVLETLGPLLRRARLDLRLTGEGADPVLTCDAARLTQVITNLVENVAQHAYGGAGGPLHVRVDADGEGARVIVRDEGGGMTADIVERCFDPFFTTRRGLGGTGLGLHLTYAAVTRALGGTIAVRSAPGDGTTFEVRLPIDPATPDPDAGVTDDRA